MPGKAGKVVQGLGEALDARSGGSENDRLRKTLEDLIAKLNEDSARNAEQQGASQAQFADALDKRILGDEEADADSLYRDQYNRQLPSERQAFAAGTSNGNSADELRNYAMIMRGRREQQGAAPGPGAGVRAAPPSDTAGFEKDFASDQKMRQRMTDMFGGKQRVSEFEKQRILADMARGANAQMAAMSAPPVTGGIPPASPNVPQLDAAAQQERRVP